MLKPVYLLLAQGSLALGRMFLLTSPFVVSGSMGKSLDTRYLRR